VTTHVIGRDWEWLTDLPGRNSDWWEQEEIVRRHKINAPNAAGPLYSDIFNKARRQLIEAKADSSRGSVRMAIGR